MRLLQAVITYLIFQYCQDLTDYLSQNLKTALTKANIPYVTCYKNHCLTNIRNFDESLQEKNGKVDNT